jgi:hypothetical protein
MNGPTWHGRTGRGGIDRGFPTLIRPAESNQSAWTAAKKHSKPAEGSCSSFCRCSPPGQALGKDRALALGHWRRVKTSGWWLVIRPAGRRHILICAPVERFRRDSSPSDMCRRGWQATPIPANYFAPAYDDALNWWTQSQCRLGWICSLENHVPLTVLKRHQKAGVSADRGMCSPRRNVVGGPVDAKCPVLFKLFALNTSFFYLVCDDGVLIGGRSADQLECADCNCRREQPQRMDLDL